MKLKKAIVDAAKRTPSPGAGYCAAWVSNVYENAGLPRPGGNACCQYLSFCTSTDRSQLKVGMVIGVQRSPRPAIATGAAGISGTGMSEST